MCQGGKDCEKERGFRIYDVCFMVFLVFLHGFTARFDAHKGVPTILGAYFGDTQDSVGPGHLPLTCHSFPPLTRGELALQCQAEAGSEEAEDRPDPKGGDRPSAIGWRGWRGWRLRVETKAPPASLGGLF